MEGDVTAATLAEVILCLWPPVLLLTCVPLALTALTVTAFEVLGLD